MPDDAVPQEETAPDAQPTDTDPGQGTPLAEDSVADAELETGSEPEPSEEAPPPEGPDLTAILSDPTHLASVLESEAVQKAIKQGAADAANKAKQEAEKRLSREAGADERVAQTVEAVLTAAGVDTKALQPQQITDIRMAFANQGTYQAVEQARLIVARNVDRYGVQGDAVNTALEFLAAGDHTQFADTFMDAVISSEVAKAKVAWDADQTANTSRKVAAELAARTKEPTTGTTIPDAPAGAAPGTGPSPSEYAAATSEQRAKWATDNVEVQIPQPV